MRHTLKTAPNTHELSPFQLGVEVQPKVTVASDYPKGLRADPMCNQARIVQFIEPSEHPEGTVRLDRALHGQECWDLDKLELTSRAKLDALLEVAQAQQAWIDAVPSEVPLPSMPGFDRDWADAIMDLHKPKSTEI